MYLPLIIAPSLNEHKCHKMLGLASAQYFVKADVVHHVLLYTFGNTCVIFSHCRASHFLSEHVGENVSLVFRCMLLCFCPLKVVQNTTIFSGALHFLVSLLRKITCLSCCRAYKLITFFNLYDKPAYSDRSCS